jgi:hypothetical protein
MGMISLEFSVVDVVETVMTTALTKSVPQVIEDCPIFRSGKGLFHPHFHLLEGSSSY